MKISKQGNIYKPLNGTLKNKSFLFRSGFGLSKYVILLLVGCLCLAASDSFAAPSTPLTIAPLNPEFVEWQNKLTVFNSQSLESYDAQGHILGETPSPIDRSHLLNQTRVQTTPLDGAPASYDLRTLGYVTPVKDQLSCGSCWAFATYGSFESWFRKNMSETWDFSENHLKNYHGFDPAVCSGGGNADMSTAYLARWSGPVLEADDPYHDSDDRPSPGGVRRKNLDKVLWFFTASDIKNAILTYGALHVSMYMDSAYYNSSQYTYYYNGSDNGTNHAVTLIGWDDNKVVVGASSNGAWLIKNSWGTGWGNNGYFWISYNDASAVKYAAAFCGTTVPAESYTTNYQYDPLGYIGDVGYDTPTAWAANIFVPAANEQLKAVGFYALDNNISYIIYVYDTFSGGTSGTFSTLLGSVSGTLVNPGYYTIPLTSPISLTTGNNFAIVVKFTTTTGYGKPIPIEVNVPGYSSAATANLGQSYVSSDGITFTDITTYSGFEKTNVCIRGLAAAVVPPAPPGPAANPNPADGAANVGLTTDVIWTAGSGTTSHDVYFGTANPPPYKATQASTIFDTATMIANTTYYWHIDEKNATGTTTGSIWSFTTVPPPPGAASNPVPSTGATGVSLTQDISWTAGSGTNSHDVYFGTVNPPPLRVNQTDTTFDTGIMTHGVTYYWRINEKNTGGTTTGAVWNFTTTPTFSLQTYATIGGGTVTTPGIGTYAYASGDNVNIAASANSNYRFVNWTGTAVTAGKVADPNSAATTVTMDKNYVLRANFATTLAFPGAEGSGRFTRGGRGGTVYEVNNLSNSGPGSIVDAVSEPNRTIVFRVSGTIPLGDVVLEPNSNITIAGQTAPGDGICLKGRIHIRNFVHDIVIRYIRVRVDAGGANALGDGIDIDQGSNIIIDHVTASYSRDEGISCQEDSNNVTVQWCIISEALTYEAHGYGSLIRGQYGQEKTYHHNLYAHNNGRNPRPGTYLPATVDPEGGHLDFRNNVTYNWKSSVSGYNDDGSGSNVLGVSRYNFIGNVFIPGSESTSTSSRQAFRERCKVAYGYFADNSYDGAVSSDPWSIVKFDSGYMTSTDITSYKARSYLIPMEPVKTTSQAQAKVDVLASAGASFPKRDIIDDRIVIDVMNKTGHSIANTDAQPEGAWPELNSLPAPTDTDHDGMPDLWETSHNLNPNDANDRNGYNLNYNYTNLEVYLNDILTGGKLPYVYWTQRKGGTTFGSSYATDIATDSAGIAYVTGYAKNAGTDYDFLTIKYKPNGSIDWTRTYNRRTGSKDYALAIAVDAGSNIIVGGYNYSATGGYDGALVKYDSAGNQLWAKSYNYSGTSDDRFYDIATDAGGNVYAVGGMNEDGLIVKYSPAGTLVWAMTYNGPGNGFDALYKLAVDSNGSVYACGESAGTGTGSDCLTVKYSPSGTLLWAKPYNGSANGADMLAGIALDSAGSVYVTGSVGSCSNYITIKYAPDGNSLWPSPSFYSAEDRIWDESSAIAISSDGNVVVTGYSETLANADAATVKYNSATGAQIWAKRYNGMGNWTDFAESIAADKSGNVYIHGRSFESGTTDYLTICYGPDGTEKWKRNYNGPAALTDMGSAIAVVDSNNVYVTGCSMNSSSNYEYATIKYTMLSCPVPPQGDLNGDCQVNLLDFAVLADDYIGSQQNYLTLMNIADTWLRCDLIEQDDCRQ